jgi:nuclease S1
VHLVGDIHQPLHAADRRDRGGNRVQVSFFGERDAPPYGSLNLHSVWDVSLVSRLVADRGGESAFVSASIAAADRSVWERGSIADWIAESHALARDRVYPMLPVPSACGTKISGVVAIGDPYYEGAAPVVGLQLRKAGVRLARVLNEALGR